MELVVLSVALRSTATDPKPVRRLSVVKRIPLSGRRGAGRFVLVDDADFEWLSKYSWCLAARPTKTNPLRGYASRGVTAGGNAALILMHREILNLQVGEQADHIDRDGLNNTRANLRKATAAENCQNQGSSNIRNGQPTSSQYKGVGFFERPGRRKHWTAHITVDRKRKTIGYYLTEIEAARGYDEAAKRLHGDFAWLNFPD